MALFSHSRTVDSICPKFIKMSFFFFFFSNEHILQFLIIIANFGGSGAPYRLICSSIRYVLYNLEQK